MRLKKAQRQHLLAQLLEKAQVASQADLVRLLAEEGVEATQVTVSRDLEELGAVKIRKPGGLLTYALPDPPPPRPSREAHLRRVMGEWVADVASSSNLVVVRTPPGCAHVVASALDRSGVEEILGTVAGDDTVLVIAREGVRGTALAEKLASLAGRGAGPGGRGAGPGGRGAGPGGREGRKGGPYGQKGRPRL
jgi:transcriptional regulator of arginine metabolism